MTITIDEEFRALIPPLRDGELALLESSLTHEGCRDALSVWNGVLIDGHNRHAICQREGLTFKTKEIALADRNAAKLWIIDNQMGRRNLSDIDRIGLQSAREEVFRNIGKANQTAALKKGSVLAKLPKRETKHDTRAACAKAAQVGERTYDAGKLVLEAEKTGEIPKEVVHGIVRTDADHIICRYKTSLDGRDFQLMMIVEVKERGAEPDKSQTDVLSFLRQLCERKGTQMRGKKTVAAVKLKSRLLDRFIHFRFYGVHLLQFQNTSPADSSWIKWNRKEVTADVLTGILAMERIPTDPSRMMIEVLRDRHNKTRQPLLFKETA